MTSDAHSAKVAGEASVKGPPRASQSRQADEAEFEYQRQLYEVYQDERRHLTEAENSLDHALSTAVLTVSGGALGISLTVLTDFEALATATASPILGLAWTMLVLALLGSLFALKINQQAHSQFRTILDEECAARLDGAFERARGRQRASRWGRVLRVSDWVNVILCIAGTSLLFLFAYCEIVKGGNSNATKPAEPVAAASPFSTTSTAGAPGSAASTSRAAATPATNPGANAAGPAAGTD